MALDDERRLAEDNERLRAENARLREAFNTFVEEWSDGCIPDDCKAMADALDVLTNALKEAT